MEFNYLHTWSYFYSKKNMVNLPSLKKSVDMYLDFIGSFLQILTNNEYSKKETLQTKSNKPQFCGL